MLRRLSLGPVAFGSLLLASGCSITVNHGDPGGGGAGGSSSTSGSGGAGGSGVGGSGVGGSGVGGSGVGVGGGGGGLPDRCTLPWDAGSCDAAFPRYWHDPSTGVCRPVTYGGCDGNTNRFDSVEQCQEACQGGAPDMDTCEAPSDCVLAPARVCSACDPIDARDHVAINRTMRALYDAAIGFSDAACAPCPEVTEAERTAQYFTATCERGHCVVLDVRESPLTECTKDAECALRDGLGCCEGCDGRGIVALNQSADIEGLVCPDEVRACPPCVPVYPEGTTAVCSEGRCVPRAPALP